MIFKLTKQNNFSIRFEIALRWMSQNLTNENSALVEVMVEQAITRANRDLCLHMASLGHNKFIHKMESKIVSTTLKNGWHCADNIFKYIFFNKILLF